MFFPDPSVWVSDSQQPFVKVQKEIPDVVYMKEGQDLVFPCRVTNPNAKVSLVKVSTSAINNSKMSSKNRSQMNLLWPPHSPLHCTRDICAQPQSICHHRHQHNYGQENYYHGSPPSICLVSFIHPLGPVIALKTTILQNVSSLVYYSVCSDIQNHLPSHCNE